MALELKSRYIINSAVTTISVQDQTGVYTANNLGGWGAPNTTRSSAALVSYLRFQPFDGHEVNLSFLNPNSNIRYDETYVNSEVSIFNYPYYKDGWYKSSLIIAPLENLGPLENDIIYDVALSKLVIFKGGVWVDLLNTDWDYLLNVEKYTSLSTEDILMPLLVLNRNTLTEAFIDCLACSSCKCNDKQEELVQLNLFMQAADYRFYSGKPFEAQKMVEKMHKIFKC